VLSGLLGNPNLFAIGAGIIATLVALFVPSPWEKVKSLFSGATARVGAQPQERRRVMFDHAEILRDEMELEGVKEAVTAMDTVISAIGKMKPKDTGAKQ